MSSLLKRSTLLFSLSLVLLFFAACRSQSDSAPTASASPETITSSTPPFQTKEPNRYRGIRTITIQTTNGETLVTKTLIARDGDMRRHEEETAGKKMVYLELPQGNFVLLTDENVYADLANETPPTSGFDEEPTELSPERLMHTDGGTSTSYQRLGTEAIAGRNANKYRVIVNSSTPGSVSVNETLIWIDVDLSMPVKSETKSADGTRVTMHLSEIALDVDRTLFQIPNNYEKVTFNELRKRLGPTQ